MFGATEATSKFLGLRRVMDLFNSKVCRNFSHEIITSTLPEVNKPHPLVGRTIVQVHA